MLRAVVFDFDLTLVDSSAGFVACHAFASTSVGLPAPGKEAILRTIGTPLPGAFRLLHGSAQETLLDEYLRQYQLHADEVMTDGTVWIDGAREAVLGLHTAGLQIAIVSQKPRYRIEDVLGRAGLIGVFDAVIAGDDVPELKPDPRGLLVALERLTTEPKASLYVGDTVIDAEAAARAGVPFVAVLSGVTRREDLTPFRTFAICESVACLPTLLGVALEA